MPVTEDPLAPPLRESWDRCISQYNLDPNYQLSAGRLMSFEVRTSRSKIEELLAVSAPTIHHLRSIAKDAGYCVLLAGPDGVVVENHCDSTEARSLKEHGLDNGSIWQESLAGTNAIGTSIFCNNPVTVSGDAHFFPAFRKFICSAAPLVDHDGEVLGAVDITGPAPRTLSTIPFIHHLIEETSTQIQAVMFRRHFRGEMLVALSQDASFAPAQATALLAVNASGRVVGATMTALTLLGVSTTASLINKSVADTLAIDCRAMETSGGRIQRIEFGKQESGYAFALPPPSKKPRPTARRPAAPTKLKHRSLRCLSLDDLAGQDDLMVKTVKLCRRFIDRDLSILLEGETGVGKDVFARALHAESERRDGAFVAVNCAAIPDTLLDSELFGYAPGTFTGGLKDGKTGKIVASDGGTLFLDEIGDMPLELQARLLRVLAEREVTPLGTVEPVPVEIKLICATHRNLPELVKAERFREDLYYRINGAKIALPPLRDRQDIDTLISAIIKEQGETDRETTISGEAWKLLLDYAWPGNIRQLRNVVLFSLYSCENNQVEIGDLPGDLSRSTAMASGPSSASTPPSRLVSLSTLRQHKDRAEMERLMEALGKARWRVTEAAASLGISRATVHRKMKEYGILRPDHR